MAIDVTKPYKFIGFGAIDVTKPYKFIGFGAIDVTKPYRFIGFGAIDVSFGELWPPPQRAGPFLARPGVGLVGQGPLRGSTKVLNGAQTI